MTKARPGASNSLKMLSSRPPGLTARFSISDQSSYLDGLQCGLLRRDLAFVTSITKAPFTYIVAKDMVTGNNPGAVLLSPYYRIKLVAAYGGEARKKERNNRNVEKIRWMLLNVTDDNVTGDKLEIGVDSRPLSTERPEFRPQKAMTNSRKSRPRLPVYLQVGAIRGFLRRNQTRLRCGTRQVRPGMFRHSSL